MRAAQAGQRKKSFELFDRFLESALSANFKEGAAWVLARKALLEAELGNSNSAWEIGRRSMALSRSRTNAPTLAVALSLAGKFTESERLITELKERYPEDTLLQSAFIPMAEGIAQSYTNDLTRSLNTLRTTARFDLSPWFNFLPIYVRGLVHLHARQGPEAAAEFQKIVAHRGVSPLAPEYALAHLNLARAYILQGDNVKGRPRTRTFLPSGKTPIPTSPSCAKPGPSTPSCNKADESPLEDFRLLVRSFKPPFT
jgi:hypothetical protein